MIVVSDFTHVKLVEHFKPGMKVLIDFPHGLGDCVMFMPLLVRMRAMYPDVTIDLRLPEGRYGDIFPAPHHNAYYDLVALLIFHESWDKPEGLSKPEFCCKHELGIPFSENLDFTWKPPKAFNPIIGVNFMCNSNSAYNVPYDVAKDIYQQLQKKGYIPMEIYFNHPQFNVKNQPYDFITCSTRGTPATVETFMGAMQACNGFIGVNSGSLCTAIAMYPELTLHLHTANNLKYYYKGDKVATIDATAEGYNPEDMEKHLRVRLELNHQRRQYATSSTGREMICVGTPVMVSSPDDDKEYVGTVAHVDYTNGRWSYTVKPVMEGTWDDITCDEDFVKVIPIPKVTSC